MLEILKNQPRYCGTCSFYRRIWWRFTVGRCRCYYGPWLGRRCSKTEPACHDYT